MQNINTNKLSAEDIESSVNSDLSVSQTISIRCSCTIIDMIMQSNVFRSDPRSINKITACSIDDFLSLSSFKSAPMHNFFIPGVNGQFESLDLVVSELLSEFISFEKDLLNSTYVYEAAIEMIESTTFIQMLGVFKDFSTAFEKSTYVIDVSEDNLSLENDD